MFLLLHLYRDCGCLPECMYVCECVCLYGGCAVFVCVSGHVCMVIVGVCMGVCMFADVRACMVIVLRLHVYLAVIAW